MELWIRSQDRENLIPVSNPICIIDTEIVYKESATYIITLAKYKTKERALEVLDEIQYKIKNMYILENCKLPKRSCIERSLARDNFNIYEMPEE
jgi:hypothetical protein